MLKKERNFEFRKRLLEIHEKNVTDKSLCKKEKEFEIKNGLTVCIPENSGDVTLTAAKDFIDYLFVSMGISAMLCYGDADEANKLVIKGIGTEAELENAYGYRGYRIDTEENGIYITGFDERGIAQALYALEDVMNMRRAPFVEYGTVKRKPLYSPQMVHSGYRIDDFPSEYLARVAHEGRDAILVFTEGLNITSDGYLDFNDLIYRASKYGIDVYAYSYIKNKVHPDEPGAEAVFESTYGKIFRECPGLRGVVLVGESVEFASKDPHVASPGAGGQIVDGIPTGKPRPGWYPCEDYPKWLNMLKKVVTKYNPDADIVFWTYNWGSQDEEARVKLIESLPEGISLLATFEMFEKIKMGDIYNICADYTLVFEGYGKYFESEAVAAKKKGIRLYSMTNTGGQTWDFGVTPYEPFPYQWMKRYAKMKEANEKWGLCGIMESHHYGFYPSFISKLSKWIFNNPDENPEEILRRILDGEYGAYAGERVDKALLLWSEAITYGVPSNADQYGAFRVGPSYPFCLDRVSCLVAAPYSKSGPEQICRPTYNTFSDHRLSITSMRLPEEIKSLQIMKEKMEAGIEILRGIENKNDKLLYLLNLGEFILHSVITGLHAKKWHVLKTELLNKTDAKVIEGVLNDMENLLREEMKNVEETIPLVQNDSRLGWEPTMEYMTDEAHLRWKIRQLNYVIDVEINENRISLNL